MDLQQASKFMNAINRHPSVNLGEAILEGEVRIPLSEEEQHLALIRVTDLDREIEEAEDELRDAREEFEAALSTQEPAVRVRDRENPPEELSRAEQRLTRVRREREAVALALEQSEKAISRDEAKRLQDMAAALPKKVENASAGVEAALPVVEAARALVEALGGKSLDEGLRPILLAGVRGKEIRTRARYCQERGQDVAELPDPVSPALVEEVNKLGMAILGREMDQPKGGWKWDRIANEQRHRDRNEAALRVESRQKGD